jgi:hypothetical protein
MRERPNATTIVCAHAPNRVPYRGKPPPTDHMNGKDSSIADHPALPIEVAHAMRIHSAACTIKGPLSRIALEHVLTPADSA